MPSGPTALRIARNNDDPRLELPLGGPQRVVTWDDDPADDGAVPPAVRRALVAALAQLGQFAWMSSNRRAPSLPWATRSAFSRFMQGMSGPSAAVLRTGEGDALFDEPYFVWAMRGQIAVVLKPDVKGLPRDAVLRAIGTRDAADVIALWRAGVRGILMPGVDGGFAGFLGAKSEDAAAFETALTEAAQKDGLSVSVSETALMR